MLHPLMAPTEPTFPAYPAAFAPAPDIVETNTLGTLEFVDGMPKRETVQSLYDNLDLMRGTEAFLSGIPISSLFALNRGLREVGIEPNEIGISEVLPVSHSSHSTPVAATVYLFSQLDLSDGPVVLDAPAGVLGLVNDAGFSHITNIGEAGPDRGDGAKYLFLPPGFEGAVPAGYFVFQSATFDICAELQASIKDGDGPTRVKAVKEHLNIYPLALADNPPPEIFHVISDANFNTTRASDYRFFEELNEVIQKEPADAFSSELTETFASIGIMKGLPFKPDGRMRGILTEAAAIGNATVRALAFSPRPDRAFAYEDRNWTLPFVSDAHEWMKKPEGVKVRRAFLHFMATGLTPALISAVDENEAAYATASIDKDGKFLDGGNTYTVTLPARIPAANSWSLVVYSNQHHSILEFAQNSRGVGSNSPDLKVNDDGSYTIWFGPKPLNRREKNWVQTPPDKSFFSTFRLYGPLEAWTEKSWKIGDFELILEKTAT